MTRTLPFPMRTILYQLSRASAIALLLCMWAGAATQAQTAGAAGGAQAGTAGSGATVSGGADQAAAPTAGQSMLYPGDDFTLTSGDLINVSVFLQPEYTATVRVSSEGTVQLPFIGSVPVQGLNVLAAQRLISDRLRTGEFYRDPEVTIRVLDTVNGSAVITGEMHYVVPVSTERSLREVLLLAGGLPANASHTIKIVRPGIEAPIVVDLGTDLASSKAASIPIKPHDIIQVTRASVVYVLGAFARQGAVPLDQSSPLTLLQLASLSGGINYEGRFDDLRLIRTVGTERTEVRVDLKKIREGKANDPILQPNDIVFLPTNAMKASLKSVGAGGVIALVSLLIAAHTY